MYILHTAIAPNNATVTFHRITKIEITDVVKAQVNSFANEAATLLLWQDTHDIPMSALSNDPYTSVPAWLVSTGAPFDGGTVVDEAETDLTIAKLKKWVTIKARRAEVMALAPTPFGTFDSDAEGKANITGMAAGLVILGESAPAEIHWKMADNNIATFTPAEFKQASLLVSQHVSDTYAVSWQIEAQINAAETVEEVEAISWPA